MKFRILIADGQLMFRDALRSFLEQQADMEVVAEVSDGRDVILQAQQCNPDVVCIDACMPGLAGIEVTRRLTFGYPGIKVIGLSVTADTHHVTDMLDAGAACYVSKGEAGDELLRAIRATRRPYISSGIRSAMAKTLVHRMARAGSPALKLSIREKEVVQLITDGGTSPQVAERLNLAPSTIETHRRNIMRKLGFHTVVQLTKYAIRNGLTSA